MPIDPVTGALITSGVSAIGGALGQSGAEREGERDRDLDIWQILERLLRDEDIRGDRNEQFAANFGLESEDARQRYGRDAVDLQGRIYSAPLRDQSQYALMGRIGNPPSNFQPRDMTRGGTAAMRQPATGGVDLNANRQRMAAYRPGAGGITTDVDRQILERMINPNLPSYTPPPRPVRDPNDRYAGMVGGPGQPRAPGTTSRHNGPRGRIEAQAAEIMRRRRVGMI